MQTPLNKRVIGRHVPVPPMWPEKAKRPDRRRTKTGLPVGQSKALARLYGYANQFWTRPSHPSPSLVCFLVFFFLFCFLPVGHLLGGRATKIKTKQRFPIKATTWPKGDGRLCWPVGLCCLRNSRPVIMRQMREAAAALAFQVYNVI